MKYRYPSYRQHHWYQHLYQYSQLQVPSKCDITNTQGSDGFGSQYQNIIATFLYAKRFNLEFCATPIKVIDHNYDERPSFAEEATSLMHMPVVQGNGVNRTANKKKWLDEFITDPENADFIRPHLFELGSRFEESRVLSTGNTRVVVHVRRQNAHDDRLHIFDDSILTVGVICNAMRSVLRRSGNMIFHV